MEPFTPMQLLAITKLMRAFTDGLEQIQAIIANADNSLSEGEIRVLQDTVDEGHAIINAMAEELERFGYLSEGLSATFGEYMQRMAVLRDCMDSDPTEISLPERTFN